MTDFSNHAFMGNTKVIAMHLILNITTQSMDYLDALLKLPTQKRTNPLSLLSFRQPKQIALETTRNKTLVYLR